VQQTSQLQAERQSWEHETHPNELCEVPDSQILPTEVQVCASGNILERIWTPRSRQMLVMRWRRQGGSPHQHAGTPLPPLQLMKGPANDALDRGGESNGMESGQMSTRASSVPKRPGRPPGFLAASILKACATGGPARPGSEAARPARDLKSLHRPA